MAFKRTQEDFVCEKCHTKIVGTGYTNHCPKCLWSKHVDIDPGDREHDCQGMMEPVRVEGTAGKFRIVHKCQKCGTEKKNSASNIDDMHALVSVATEAHNKK